MTAAAPGGHYRRLLAETSPRTTIAAWDLVDAEGRPRSVTVEIAGIAHGTVYDTAARKEVARYVVQLKGARKSLVLSPTIGGSIAAALGTGSTTAWIGQRVTLRPALTTVGREVVECVRLELTPEQVRSPYLSQRCRAKLLEDARLRAPTARIPEDPRTDLPRVGGGGGEHGHDGDDDTGTASDDPGGGPDGA